jgi:hypothetical protein
MIREGCSSTPQLTTEATAAAKGFSWSEVTGLNFLVTGDTSATCKVRAVAARAELQAMAGAATLDRSGSATARARWPTWRPLWRD